ncbi:MAG: hypothetical protein HYZ29_11975 [Myxococcales bacterium]|nr:hypothetical protein [Myxococcales bacterium]
MSKAIGPTGGELVSADGRARLDVPAGALTGELTITIAPAAAAPGGALGPAYDLLPHGTTFEAPVFLTMPLDVQPGTDAYAQLATVIDGQWVPIPGSGLLEGGSAVIGATNHFSTFAAKKLSPPKKPANDPCACNVTAWMGCCNTAPYQNPLLPYTWGGGSPAGCWCANASEYTLWSCYEGKTGNELGGCTKCERKCCQDVKGSTYASDGICGCSKKAASACLKACAATNQDKTKCELGAGGTGGTGGAGGTGSTGGAGGTGGSPGGGAGGTGATGATGGAGGTVSACAAPAGPVGAATTTGTVKGKAVAPVDAYVETRVDTANVWGKYIRWFEFRITEYAKACGLEQANLEPAYGRWLGFRLTRWSNSAPVADPTPGTYPIGASPPQDTWTMTQPGILEVCPGGGGPCGYCGSLATCASPAGSVTISTIDSNAISGSFTYTCDGETVSGTFTAPRCFAGEDAGKAQCCSASGATDGG